MIHKKYLALILIVFFNNSGWTQLNNIGKVVSIKKISGGIEGRTTSALFDIHVYSDNIIRVRVTKNKLFNNFSYALTDSQIPSFSDINIIDKKNSIQLSTAAIEMEIEKEPAFRVIFKNKKGVSINEDVSGQGFGTTFIGNKISIYKKLQVGERFVGLGEALGNLDRRGTGITLNNTDNYKYGDPRVSMYSSIPFYIGMHHDLLYGMFYNNSYKSFFNFGLSTPDFTSVNIDGGDCDYFFIYDTTVGKIIEHYTSLTGHIQLPPLWSLGYHQSRCSYYPQEKVQWIAETFRKKQIPIDCIVLDADYLHEYEPFRINTQRFPDMPGLAANLLKDNIELTASVNPGIKIDSSYEAYKDGLKKDVFIKYFSGDLFISDIWPSTNHFVDFTDPKAREWWIEKMKFLPDNGIHGYWNDMNEPAVNGSYLPDNLLFDFDGRKTNALEAKNVYGFQMARSSFESAVKYGNGKRPFVLTRSGFAGIQRYAAVWSGDNTAKDDYLLNGILLNCQMGLSGIPFTGYDVGGYIGDASKDLYMRWIEAGVFSPFFRNHREFFGAAGEPWAYGEEAEAISKTYISFRYRLLPYIYAAFYEAAQTGMPIARSLCINYPFDEKVYNTTFQYQFLFGSEILVAAVQGRDEFKKIYLPKGNWYDLNTGELLHGNQELIRSFPIYTLPLFARASAIIPMQNIIQSTKNLPGDTLYVHVFNGDEKNNFTYYEDDGATMQYQKNFSYRKEIEFNPTEKQLIFQSKLGSYSSQFHYLQIIFHGFGDSILNMKLNNKPLPIINSSLKIIDGLNNLTDIYDTNYIKNLRDAEVSDIQKVITVPNSDERMVLEW